MTKQPSSISAKATKNYVWPIRVLILAGLVILSAVAIAWQVHVQNDPSRVFWGAIDNNLHTTSVVRQVKDNDGSQVIEQTINVVTAPQHATRSQTVRTIETGTGNPVKVSTEDISTPATSYVRYTDIKTDQKGADGKPLNFAPILNVWGKDAPVPGDQTPYGNSVLGLMQFGNLSKSQRAEIIKKMQTSGVYTIKSSSVTHTGLLHRPVQNVKVEVKVDALVGTLKEYAEIVGLSQLRDLDASQYANSPPVEINISIDSWSHQIRSLAYGEGAHAETFSGYGNAQGLGQLPADKDTIPMSELQSRLQTLR